MDVRIPEEEAAWLCVGDGMLRGGSTGRKCVCGCVCSCGCVSDEVGVDSAGGGEEGYCNGELNDREGDMVGGDLGDTTSG